MVQTQRHVVRSIEFTQQEAQAAIDLLHIATQSRGLEVAEVAVLLRNKLFTAFQDSVDSDVQTSDEGRDLIQGEPKPTTDQ